MRGDCVMIDDCSTLRHPPETHRAANLITCERDPGEGRQSEAMPALRRRSMICRPSVVMPPRQFHTIVTWR